MKRLLSTILFLSAQLASAASYDGLVVFGDSLADTGNLAATNTLPYLNQEPYYQGHGTNGKVSVEIVAEKLQLPLATSYFLSGQVYGNNFAVYGARTGTIQPIDLTYQVGAYLQSTGGAASPNSLYVIVIGGNDVRAARDAADAKTASGIIRQAIRDFETNLNTLVAAGARHILVTNVPDLTTVPETRMLAAAHGEQVTKFAKIFTLQYDGLLALVLAKARYKNPDVSFKLFNAYREFNAIRAHASRYGFTNSDDNCWSGYVLAYQNGCDASQFDSFVFFDDVHSTAAVNRIIGQKIYDRVK